jgi:hypothetical protein
MQTYQTEIKILIPKLTTHLNLHNFIIVIFYYLLN